MARRKNRRCGWLFQDSSAMVRSADAVLCGLQRLFGGISGGSDARPAWSGGWLLSCGGQQETHAHREEAAHESAGAPTLCSDLVARGTKYVRPGGAVHR